MLIEHSVARLDATVSATRRMEQATAELIDPPREAINISALLLGMLKSHRDTMESDRLHLDASIEDGIFVRGSEELFETIIDNLLENATSFAPEGSTISVALANGQGHAVLSVGDQGPGVPEADLERIFERYFSRRSAETGAGTNFGIGLWIVRRNVEAVGGKVRATNRAETGLEVKITLPVSTGTQDIS